jgi:lipoate-protein ligase A
MRPLLHLLTLNGVSIYRQLEIEEALLRTDRKNWCLFNQSSTPAIVMGLSGKPEELIDLDKVKASPISMIKRFSGGGTVVVDENTLFVTLIGCGSLFEGALYPEPIMRWTTKLYSTLGVDLQLRENDYVIGDRKCGGNAQYICKDRWLHHTSFLWDYAPHRMEYLLLPKRAPRYREGRSHYHFLTPLKEHLPSPNILFDQLTHQLHSHFSLVYVEEKEVAPMLARPHRRATHLIPI